MSRSSGVGYNGSAMSVGAHPETFEVVFVCTGNRARSPLAAALLRQATSGLDVVVSSYGTLDVGPLPPLPDALLAAERLGVDLSGHRARVLPAGGLVHAALVLGFEPDHVAAAAIEARADPGRTFLLAELTRLLDGAAGDAAVEHARSLVSAADARRVRSRPDPAATIADPLGLPREGTWRVAQSIALHVDRLAASLFGNEGYPPGQARVQ